MRARSVNFERGQNPKSSMGIGYNALIKKWLETWAPYVEYTIDNDKNIIVEESLYLEGTEITELPDNLTITGDLDLENCKMLSKLPNNLKVEGNLNLEGCEMITEFPDNLKVGGYLDLSGTKITKLPDNLTVKGSLYLTGTPISKLPNNLTVRGKILKDF